MKLFERGIRYKLKVPYEYDDRIYTHIEPTEETSGKSLGECWPFNGDGPESKTAYAFCGVGSKLAPLPKFNIEDTE